MKAERKSIPKSTRFEVFKRDSFTCQYCGQSAPNTVLQIDHIHPVSKDGDNDILNLITSCEDCNSGKSDRLLSDDSAIQRQKAQLDELNERREQLELMLQWRNELKNLDQDVLEVAHDEWKQIAVGYSLNDSGLANLKKLINKFGLSEVLDAMEQAKSYLREDDSGALSEESVNTAFNKIGGICRTKQQPEWKREIYYIRGILRKRLQYCNEKLALQLLEDAHVNNGVSLEDLRYLALTVTSWTKFLKAMNTGTW